MAPAQKRVAMLPTCHHTSLEIPMSRWELHGGAPLCPSSPRDVPRPCGVQGGRHEKGLPQVVLHLPLSLHCLGLDHALVPRRGGGMVSAVSFQDTRVRPPVGCRMPGLRRHRCCSHRPRRPVQPPHPSCSFWPAVDSSPLVLLHLSTLRARRSRIGAPLHVVPCGGARLGSHLS